MAIVEHDWHAIWERKSRGGLLSPTLMCFRVPTDLVPKYRVEKHVRAHALRACPEKWRGNIDWVEMDTSLDRKHGVFSVRFWMRTAMRDTPTTLDAVPEYAFRGTSLSEESPGLAHLATSRKGGTFF